jgi:hypothetical protein
MEPHINVFAAAKTMPRNAPGLAEILDGTEEGKLR